MEILMLELVIQHSSFLEDLLGHLSCPLGELISQGGPQMFEDNVSHPRVWGVRWVSAPKSNRET